jgi:thiamine biosynthesis lipoprotein
MLERREFLKFKSSRHAPSDGYWVHLSRPAMACRFEVTLPLKDRDGVRVARPALEEVERLEQQLSVFRENSEVSLVNRNAASYPVSIDSSLFALIRLCLELSRETGGAFDITSGPLSRCWGFMQRQGRIPGTDELEEVRSLIGSDKLLLDPQSRTIRFARPGVEINFGSIGKGYALDRITEKIRHRVQTALLSAGSSSICAIGSGDRRQNGWVVGLRHPRSQERRLAIVRMSDSSLSTSGSEEQFFDYQGKRYGHIIDPRTGSPAECVTSVTVIAQSSAMTDALATAFYVGGRELAERYCAAHSEILTIMLLSGSADPILLGARKNCKVEIINE